ncbi:conserved hypothetical protein [Nitrobacter hamburgensis X14]|uniref:Uncharacterized protein n=1 Tax=Nitrobacter hamburgensis (strain DSM 10229 / NCIMB 13809 / X14) TaxID=323097 RepID=Q1QKR2_NITHX|nr:hypothetical protein [Nitrobacter hamburgensis]ABE63185.1 conserved hypothetical protein [Nitrobacter hamburgensis X14]
MTASVVKVRWADQNLKHFGKKLVQLNTRFPKVLPRIVNQVGDRAKTQVIRNLTRQTGLPRKTIVNAVGDPGRAHARRLSYEMVTRGGNIRLKFLAPRETRPGVTAKPWGKRQLFPGTFMKGGRFPHRKVVEKFNGHVYRRLNTSGTRITQARSGMFIPTEMTTGSTKAAFERIAAPLLQQRVEAAIHKLLG